MKIITGHEKIIHSIGIFPSKNIITVSGDQDIKIWEKNQNGKGYLNKKTIQLNGANDLLLINNDCFMSTVPSDNKLIFRYCILFFCVPLSKNFLILKK